MSSQTEKSVKTSSNINARVFIRVMGTLVFKEKRKLFCAIYDKVSVSMPAGCQFYDKFFVSFTRSLSLRHRHSVKK
jgi:hypothetical protein